MHQPSQHTIHLIALALCLALAGCDSNGDSNGTSNTISSVLPETGSGDDQGVTDPSYGDSNDSPAGATVTTAIGDVFVFGSANRSTYTFANDTSGVSNCSGNCLVNWPIVEADSAVTDGQFSTINRDDGTIQWAFKNRPLYYYQGDASEGETNGEGLGGVWFVARPDPVTTAETSLGTVLAGKGSIGDGSDNLTNRRSVDGLTLYTFRNDTLNTSVCNDQCAANWPPLYADNGSVFADGFTLITRSDGSNQWAIDGQALYFYAGDSTAGDTNGNGVGGVWDIAVP